MHDKKLKIKILKNRSSLMNWLTSFGFHQLMFFTLYTYDCTLLYILIYLISLQKMNIFTLYMRKVMSAPFHFPFKVLLWCLLLCLYKAHDLYKRFNHAMLFFEFVSTILIHKCFVKQACKTHFIPNLENIKTES